MGLDISTYTKAQWEHNEACDWSDYQSSDDVPSTEFPDNINNRRYLRSSYNAGGFNRVVPEVTGNEHFTYYGILAPFRLPEFDESDFKVTPESDFAEARRRAEECVDALSALKDAPVYRVDSQRAMPLRPDLLEGESSDDALKLFHKQKEDFDNSPHPFGGWYSNAFGSFYFGDDPLKVVAAMPGKDVLGAPCVHLVYETTLHESYLESAKVLVEFIDELEILANRDGAAYVSWSG